MKVYLDLILILNFFIDFILLLSTSIILKRNSSIKRIILAAFLGSLSIIILFLNLNSFFVFIYKFLVSLIMILVAFRFNDIRYTFKNLLYLYINSIVLGGTLYLLNLNFSNKHIGIVFVHSGISINLIALIILSPIILYLYIKQIKSYKNLYQNYYNIIISVNKKEYNYVGFLDTGCNLVDSISKKKVILIDKRKILFKFKEFRLIPSYNSTGYNLIKCIKIDYLIFNSKKYTNILLGIIDNISIDGVDVLLNNELMEDL